jgi:hypothetical protein
MGEGEQQNATENQLRLPYDTRLQQYLSKLATSPKRGEKKCLIHSFPQANSLLDSNGNVNTNLAVLGDMREMAGILDLVDFQYHPEKENQTQEW